MVIKTQDYKEYDKLVWLYTEEIGKITVIAKGAKKGKNNLISMSLPFCYGNFSLYKGKTMYTMVEGQIIESFQILLQDFITLTYASYICELIDISMIEQEKNTELFRYLISTFYLIKSKSIDIEILIISFELKLLNYTGYSISYEECVMCRKKIKSSNYLNLQYFGGVCDQCEKIRGISITNSAYNTMKFLERCDIQAIHRIQIREIDKIEIRKVLNEMMSSIFMKVPKSLKLINYFKGE